MKNYKKSRIKMKFYMRAMNNKKEKRMARCFYVKSGLYCLNYLLNSIMQKSSIYQFKVRAFFHIENTMNRMN